VRAESLSVVAVAEVFLIAVVILVLDIIEEEGSRPGIASRSCGQGEELQEDIRRQQGFIVGSSVASQGRNHARASD